MNDYSKTGVITEREKRVYISTEVLFSNSLE